MVKYLILISGVAIALFILTLLFRKSGKKSVDYTLMFWFITAIIHLTYYFLFFNQLLSDSPILVAFGNTLPVVHIFIISIYINQLRRKINNRLVLVFAIISLAYFFLFLFMVLTGRVELTNILYRFNPQSALWLKVVNTSQILVYVIVTTFSLRSLGFYRINLKMVYSSGVTSVISWLGYWTWSYLVGSLIVVFAFVLLNFDVLSYQNSIISLISVLTLQIFLVGQFGAIHNFHFPEIPAEQGKYRSSGLKELDKSKLKLEFIDYLNTNKPYLNPTISLHELSQEMNVPPYQLSQLINETLKTNYYDLINTYRVNEFKEKIKVGKDKKLSILGVAQEAGFNSKSGFYKAFQKITGMTPSQYKNSQERSLSQ